MVTRAGSVGCVLRYCCVAWEGTCHVGRVGRNVLPVSIVRTQTLGFGRGARGSRTPVTRAWSVLPHARHGGKQRAARNATSRCYAHVSLVFETAPEAAGRWQQKLCKVCGVKAERLSHVEVLGGGGGACLSLPLQTQRTRTPINRWLQRQAVQKQFPARVSFTPSPPSLSGWHACARQRLPFRKPACLCPWTIPVAPRRKRRRLARPSTPCQTGRKFRWPRLFPLAPICGMCPEEWRVNAPVFCRGPLDVFRQVLHPQGTSDGTGLLMCWVR